MLCCYPPVRLTWRAEAAIATRLDQSAEFEMPEKGPLMQTSFTLRTNGQGLYELTDHVADWLAQSHGSDGLLMLFVGHTS